MLQKHKNIEHTKWTRKDIIISELGTFCHLRSAAVINNDKNVDIYITYLLLRYHLLFHHKSQYLKNNIITSVKAEKFKFRK